MTAPGQSDSSDLLGHALLQQRVDAVWGLLRGVLESPTAGPVELPEAGVVVTGVGSSEAHARYLVGLLNEWTPVPAEFVPLGAFAEPEVIGPSRRRRGLIVFSQGLAPNARLALDRAGEFAGTVLFTAATVAGQKAAGRPDRAELVERLLLSGARVESFPIEDEYTLLVRVIGPACGFGAARRFVAAVVGSRLGPASDLIEGLESLVRGPWPARVAARMVVRVEEHRRGFVVLAPPSVSGCAQNLAAKFVEGLYWPPPRIVETLELAHGTFQQLIERRAPIWVLGEDPLARRASGMLQQAGIEPFALPLPAAPDAAPMAVEFLFNGVVAQLARELGIDQVNWPGKGLDGPLYQFSGNH
jgi:creatinine amidohydrolase